jgi:RNA polymerase sigma factor (sigma-70 family)
MKDEKLTPEEICEARSRLKNFAKRKGIPAYSASDLANSTIRSVLCQDESKYTLSYLFRTLRNKLIDRFRRKKKTQVAENLELIPDQHYQSPLDKIIEDSEYVAFFEILFELLNEREHRIFRLHYIQAKERAEMCETMKITQGALANSLRMIYQKAELARIRSQSNQQTKNQ